MVLNRTILPRRAGLNGRSANIGDLMSHTEEIEPIDRNRQKHKFQIDHFPDFCPECRLYGEQIQLEADFMSGSEIKLAMRCPRRDCDAVYFAVYAKTRVPKDTTISAGQAALSRLEPVMPQPYAVPANVKALSPDFAEIVSQAKKADDLHLTEVAGPGYRKALEFLIKDYLIKSKFAGDEARIDDVRKSQLMPCIKMLEDGNIKSVAKRATWLGNDETHYERRWTDKDITDLKALLRLTVLHIQSDLETQEYMKAMPDSGPASLS